MDVTITSDVGAVRKLSFFFKAQRSDFINKDFKFRCSKPVCCLLAFPCFATVDSSLIFHSKFNIVRKVLTLTNTLLFELA